MAFHPSYSTNEADYAFLAHPPPQKKRTRRPPPLKPNPMQPNRRRSNTFSEIAAWASQVQPGSPGTLSPGSSLGKSRCTSILSVRATSASFLQLTPTPTTVHITTPSVRDFKTDLTTVGYTSVFLQLPNTPISATLSFSVKPPSSDATKCIPIQSVPSATRKPGGLTRFRSLSVLRSRSRSKGMDSPTKTNVNVAASVVKRKKSKYGRLPPTLANELALMQFINGGSMDNNIKRIMATQTKATGAVNPADVYCDGQGGVWMDQDEAWEYAHLLAEGGECHRPWATFDNNTPPCTACSPEDERRGSVSSHGSDLNAKRVVQPVDLLAGDDVARYGSGIPPLATCTPRSSVLAFPCRPRRVAMHLQKPDFLVDAMLSPGVRVETVDPKGKERRRPAPLTFSTPSPTSELLATSPVDADKVRQEFIESSFEPAPVSVSQVVPRADARARLICLPWKTRAVYDGPMSLSVKGLFRSGGKQDRT